MYKTEQLEEGKQHTKQAGSTLLLVSFSKLSNFQVVDGLEPDLLCWYFNCLYFFVLWEKKKKNKNRGGE